MSDVKLIPQVYIVSEKGHWHRAESFIKTVDEVLAKHKVGKHQVEGKTVE